MLSKYIDYLMSQAIYLRDKESGDIIGNVPGYQGYYSCGINFEDARLNLRDAIEGVVMMKLLAGNGDMKNDIHAFISDDSQYAKTHSTIA